MSERVCENTTCLFNEHGEEKDHNTVTAWAYCTLCPADADKCGGTHPHIYASRKEVAEMLGFRMYDPAIDEPKGRFKVIEGE